MSCHSHRQWDVIIIGSGISSLVCAALLAKNGKSVCVLEQYNKPGGYLHCFTRDGYRFDTGAHYIGAVGPGQPFRVLLEYLGVYDETLFTPLDRNGFDVLNLPNGERFELPVGYPETIAALSAKFPGEEKAIRGYFEKIRQAVELFPTYRFNDEMDLMAMASAMETSLASVVGGLTQNKKLQTVLTAYCALHGVRSSDVSFGLHAIVTDSLTSGAYGMPKGGDALALAFGAQIERWGGTIRLKKKVARIENLGKLAKAVVTDDGDRYEAEWIISSAHPKKTFDLLSDVAGLSPAFRNRIANLEESAGIFGLYGTYHANVGIEPLKNYYFFGTDALDEIFERREIDDLPAAVFLSSASRNGPVDGVLPVNIHAIAPIRWFEKWRGTIHGSRPAEYEAAKTAYAEKIIEAIDRHVPEFASRFKTLATSSPLTNLHFNGAPDGTAYGIYHSLKNTGARALGPRTHVANLLLTGQNCLFPGLLGASISGLRTSGHIIGIKPVLRELKEAMGRSV